MLQARQGSRMGQPWHILAAASRSSRSELVHQARILGGTSAAERSRRKREALAELTRQALKGMRR